MKLVMQYYIYSNCLFFKISILLYLDKYLIKFVYRYSDNFKIENSALVTNIFII